MNIIGETTLPMTTPGRHSRRLELKGGTNSYQMGEVASLTTKRMVTFMDFNLGMTVFFGYFDYIV